MSKICDKNEMDGRPGGAAERIPGTQNLIPVFKIRYAVLPSWN